MKKIRGSNGEKEKREEKNGNRSKKEGNYPNCVSLFNLGPYECKKKLKKRGKFQNNSGGGGNGSRVANNIYPWLPGIIFQQSFTYRPFH